MDRQSDIMFPVLESHNVVEAYLFILYHLQIFEIIERAKKIPAGAFASALNLRRSPNRSIGFVYIAQMAGTTNPKSEIMGSFMLIPGRSIRDGH